VRFSLRGQRRDADRLQEFALPVHQALPDGVLPLSQQPRADVHPVHGDAGQNVGLALFVAYEFA
jgi:hypothetical protein